MGRKRILFAGYAPVHFLCFLPVYKQLKKYPELDLVLSGGFKQKTEQGNRYSLDGFYDGFDVPSASVIPVEQARTESFDALICSHLSDDFFPSKVGKSVQIFHGVSFKNLAVREKALRFDMLCLPGRYHAEKYLQNGLVRRPGPECLLTGFPKSDALVSGELDRRALMERFGLDKRLPTVLFAPTGEKHNALETAGEAVLNSITGTGRFNLLIKPHDHPKNQIDWFQELKRFENDRVKVVRDKDVVPLLNAADLLITDASSVAVEYTLLDRPILFIDVPKLFKRVSKRAPAMDLQTYGRKIGSIVEDPAKTAEAIIDSLANPDREGPMRRAMAAHVFHGPGFATHAVTEVILYAAGLINALPAQVEQIEAPVPGDGGMPPGGNLKVAI